VTIPITPEGYVPRPYPDIVRDLLTTLTGGTVRETQVVPAGDVITLGLLADRPIRRVSHLEGVIEATRKAEDGTEESVEIPYRFTDADFELIATGAHGDENDAIRFRPTGRKPPTGSTVTVNYYPTQTRPTPITDVNIGSVSRTLMEAVARELALAELHLEQVYRSAFVDTAEGSALDQVVGLVGVTRRPAGVATVPVRFSRAAGTVGRITIPVGTVVSDPEGNRYATTAPLIIEPGESSRQVLTAAVSRSTQPVAAGAINRVEVLIAGVATPTNEDAAVAAAAPETDDDLRRRAKGALAIAARGTIDALRFGLRSIPGVRAVTVTEFPHGVPGELAIDVAYEREDVRVAAEVADRIEELRPAGVRVINQSAASAQVTVEVTLTLAGSGVPAAALASLQNDVESVVSGLVDQLPPGATLRQSQMSAAVLADARIVDAELSFTLGGAPATSVTAPQGSVLTVATPFAFTISTETGAAGPGSGIQVDANLPAHPVPGVTAAEVTSTITTRVESWLRQLTPGSTITVDALVAAVRDDSRYVLVRADVAVVVEAADRFLQLSDGVGAYPVAPGDTATARSVVVDVREGSV
jgi:uncharacterized phage protein gp47/JayE